MKNKCKKSDGKRLGSVELAAKNARVRTNKIRKLVKVCKDQPNNFRARDALNQLALGWNDGSKR